MLVTRNRTKPSLSEEGLYEFKAGEQAKTEVQSVVFRHLFNLPSKQNPRRQPFPPMKSPPFVYRRCGARPVLGAKVPVTKPQFEFRSSRFFRKQARPWQKYDQRILQQQQQRKLQQRQWQWPSRQLILRQSRNPAFHTSYVNERTNGPMVPG